jgi:3-deoxy-D-manno-octulosonate 8-phosphate phosphatase (KDO 8-P phosphatase)
MTESNSAKHNMARIRAIALDVDGVLTDGGFWWGPGGDEWKRFCFADIMGISLAHRAGIEITLISGEDSPLIDRYALKMQIRHFAKGCRDKAAALREFADQVKLDLDEICFVGDDVNDLSAMQIAGFSAAPANAARSVLGHASFIATANGGNGAVRELIELLLAARGLDAKALYIESGIIKAVSECGHG